MAAEEQSYATHRRFVPSYHFFIVPVLVINAVIAIKQAVVIRSAPAIWLAVVGIALAWLALVARTNALRVQDRLIRLEEQLRLQRVLPAELQPRINELRPSQLVALRFCTDAELPELTNAILAGDVVKTDDIKKRIRTWRPDYLRV
jgi:hypothetical protein